MSATILIYSISRRGAEEAEAAEIFILEALRHSALSASSAPLRETSYAPFGAEVTA
jgi:hypothetical protein